MRQDTVWQGEGLVQTYLSGVRGGIPYAADQIDIMLRVLEALPPFAPQYWRDGEPGSETVGRFMDLGCGGGTLAAAVLSRFPQARGVLVDFSAPMLGAARESLAAYGAQLQFVEADFGLADWHEAVSGEGPFDAIVSGYAIHHQPDTRKRPLYGEVYDLLRSGGMFINVEHVASATPWLEHLSDELMIDSLYGFHQRSGTDKSREQVDREFVHRPDKVANILAPVDDQCDWLREIGFQDVDCYFKVFELAVFGGRRP